MKINNPTPLQYYIDQSDSTVVQTKQINFTYQFAGEVEIWSYWQGMSGEYNARIYLTNPSAQNLTITMYVNGAVYDTTFVAAGAVNTWRNFYPRVTVGDIIRFTANLAADSVNYTIQYGEVKGVLKRNVSPIVAVPFAD